MKWCERRQRGVDLVLGEEPFVGGVFTIAGATALTRI
jgi:hypothetical protein